MSKRSKRSRSTCRKHFPLKAAGKLAAAASLVATCEGYSAVIIVPVNEVVPSGFSEVFDIDGDGNNDILLNAMSYDYYMQGMTYSVPLGGTVSSNVCIDIENPTYLLAYQACDLVSWDTAALSVYGSFPPDFNDQVRFVQFSFYPGGGGSDTHWGWAELEIHSSNGDLEVLAFGYEDRPDTPLLAGDCTTGITENIPSAPLALMQNSPNPFSSQTEIEFELPSAAAAVIHIYDVTGRRVKKIETAIATQGLNNVLWDGRDETGRNVMSGIYFYRLEALGMTQTRRMVIIR